MNPVVILLPAFLISLVALAVFIWSMHRGAFGRDTVGAGPPRRPRAPPNRASGRGRPARQWLEGRGRRARGRVQT